MFARGVVVADQTTVCNYLTFEWIDDQDGGWAGV